jgi:hypothetical protein
MQTRKPLYDNLFLSVNVLASLFVITELIMNSFGRSLCVTEGCALTAQAARYGDVSIFISGLAVFVSLATLTLVNRIAQKPGLERLINLILVISLAGEGFFMGYLAFRLHAACLFCIIICCFMVVLGLIRLMAGEKDLFAGFATFAAMFAIQYLILPAGVPVHLPENERLILFFSKDCKHCVEVIKEFDERKIHVAHEPVNGYAGFLKNMGIEHVPTLMVNDPYQKVFLTGKDAIMRYLLSCTEAKQAEPKKKAQGKNSTPAKGTNLMLDIFNQPSLLTAPSGSPADAGMCKEEEICK